MNIPAVILWNLAPCSRLTKCHQLGQWRVYFGLAFLIEETSLYLTKCTQSASVPNSSVSLRWIQKGEGAQETREPAHLEKTQWFQTWGTKRERSPKVPRQGWGCCWLHLLNSILITSHRRGQWKKLLRKNRLVKPSPSSFLHLFDYEGCDLTAIQLSQYNHEWERQFQGNTTLKIGQLISLLIQSCPY